MSKDMSRIYGAGIIGAGWVATARHIPALMRDGRVSVNAVYDRSLARAEAAARKFNIPVATDDMDRLIHLSNDFVSICTPPQSHASLAVRALEAGRHVLVEKPMAMTVEEAGLMALAARSRDLRLVVCHNLLFSRSVTRALQALEDAGPIQHVLAVQLSNPDRRLPSWYHELPGGLFFDEAPHMTYLLRRLLGEPSIDQVWTRTEPGGQAIDFLEARLSHNGVSANLTMGFNTPVSEWGLTIIGTKKIVTLNLFRDICTVVANDGRHGPAEVMAGSLSTALQSATGFVSSGLRYSANRLLYGHEGLVEAFVDSLGGAPPPVSLEDSIGVVRTMTAMLARSGIAAPVLQEAVA